MGCSHPPRRPVPGSEPWPCDQGHLQWAVLAAYRLSLDQPVSATDLFASRGAGEGRSVRFPFRSFPRTRHSLFRWPCKLWLRVDPEYASELEGGKVYPDRS